jgi:hypothetical protein
MYLVYLAEPTLPPLDVGIESSVVFLSAAALGQIYAELSSRFFPLA